MLGFLAVIRSSCTRLAVTSTMRWVAKFYLVCSTVESPFRCPACKASISSATTEIYISKSHAHFGRPFTDSKRVGVAKLKLAEVVRWRNG